MNNRFLPLTARARWSRRQAVGFMAVVGATGLVALALALAAGPFVAVEPEAGQLSGKATQVTDAQASGGRAVAFNSTATLSSAPPPKGGYFSTQPVGAWSSLPSGAQCAAQVHQSTWEPRPWNYKRNHVMPDASAVHAAFAARPRAVGGAYDTKWDTFLLARVDGQFTGTTDEIFQWAACKWGINDDLLRATAVFESTWYQYLTYPSGRCVKFYSCGDFFGTPDAASKIYCDFIDGYGYAYQSDYGPGQCPQTFSIIGLKDWQAPAWGQMPDNQNGAFPFNRDSTAFALDYYAAHLRGCYEGWEKWLTATTTGDLMGCAGSWLSGNWHDPIAEGRITNLTNEMADPRWLKAAWPNDKPGCDATYGCPGPDPY